MTYEQLLAHSAHVAFTAHAAHPLGRQDRWILEHRADLVDAIGAGHADAAIARSAPGRFLTAAATDHRVTRPLWTSLMLDWPMGDYPAALARLLHHRYHLPATRILELGAGVGNLTRLLPSHRQTDLHPDVTRGVTRWDFDQPPPDDVACPGGYDLIVACNAMHCARFPHITLAHCRRLLAPAGEIWLAEGQPVDGAGRPWALTWAFGIMDGWWDRGGFRTLRDWQDQGPLGMHCHDWPVVSDHVRVGSLIRWSP